MSPDLKVTAATDAFETIVAPRVSRIVDAACGEPDTAWLILMHGVVLTVRSVNTYFNPDGSVKTVQLTCGPVPSQTASPIDEVKP